VISASVRTGSMPAGASGVCTVMSSTLDRRPRRCQAGGSLIGARPHPARTSITSAGAPAPIRTGTPQSCWCSRQTGCSASMSQLAARPDTCRTPDPIDGSTTNVRTRSIPVPVPPVSSAGGVELTCNWVAGPKLVSSFCPGGGGNTTRSSTLPAAMSVGVRAST